MATVTYNERFDSLVFEITEKAKKLDSITKIPTEQVSTDSQSFEMYGMLPDFKKIYRKDYINSLFLLRKLVGRDILVSDLKKLSESKKNGIMQSYLEGILEENGNCAVESKYNHSIDYFLPARNEINKFYISNERITFFSGTSFYFEKSSGKFYDFSRINENEAKLGELILKNISQEERQLRLKNYYNEG
ncbi:MAG: hypothetical protein OH338_03820 [Candidatus Parvarchaeota archaeon]|nr:hypothetical protein [Candidatus Parvarchaeum tengchongense]MCW1295787.1 hypothetical protein [Candidatus Parvarchaeum tengchongense]MCW1298869.1 hypothetical protein [Candidatus Parvarchaeum tengchongense]MCW1312526.1 hypothetical protein [Candidatus Parvarchaeum tengchongense]